ncbi:hypothetical protein AU106_gp058 [Sinorhizobium phage phiM9]|uniref:Uncharacterized protein n=1 Tax=Sinorhizobium phage phiM9 TaxID=1636182 RepID=A0A0F6TGQ3_9CAUD|nr:hypothetical protein AU106_gp058 [Sinorhizobium phage phiM9]AKE44689.1 hypothetical protein Sm_phiM9_059 [Sinorhizobium phage phiM9]
MLYSELMKELEDLVFYERNNTARTALSLIENRKHEPAVDRVKYAMLSIKVLLSHSTVNLTYDTRLDSAELVREFSEVERIFHMLATCYIFLKTNPN